MSDNILNIITDFLRFWKQRVVSNGQSSPWVSIEASVLQGSILGLLLFTLMTCLTIIYQHLLSWYVQMMCPFFSIVQNVKTSLSHLNSGLSKISNWAFQWKMSFNPSKQVNKPRKLFSLVKSKRLAILPFISIINWSNKSLLKSIWDWF